MTGWASSLQCSVRKWVQRGISIFLIVLLSACDGDPRPLLESVEASDLNLVSISITPNRTFGDIAYVNIDESVQFSVAGVDAAGNAVSLDRRNRFWKISNTDAGAISRDGRFTALANGQVSVGLELGGLVATEFVLEVSDAELDFIVDIEGSTEASQCSESSYTADGFFTDNTERPLFDVNWSIPSDVPDGSNAIAKIVSEIEGTVTVGAMAPGQYTLRASVGSASTDLTVSINADLASLALQPSEISIQRGQSLGLGARALRDDDSSNDATRVVNWSLTAVNDEQIATLSNARGSSGQLRGVSPGVGTVTASCGDIMQTAELTVVELTSISSIELEPDDSPLELDLSDGEEQLRAFAVTNNSVDDDVNSRVDITNQANWEVTSGTEFLSVDNSGSVRGEVTPLAEGTATLRVSYLNQTRTVTVNIVP